MVVLFSLLLLLFSTLAHATVWQVGPARALTTPAAAAAVVQNGDTVEFDAAEYTQGAVWTKNNLTLRSVAGGLAIMRGGAVNGKAIWLLTGNNTTIEAIFFISATVPDGNGAGVKLEGQTLTVRYCYFYNNENGILVGGAPGAGTGSNILVEYSQFGYNGSGDGSTHNVYISNSPDSFTFQFNWSHGSQVGHLVKSRAMANDILYNRLVDDIGGRASLELDLPCGGVNRVIGNIIRQDANTENSAVFDHGNEISAPLNCSTRPQSLVFAFNTVVNDRFTSTFMQVRGSPSPLTVLNNLFAGGGIFDGVTPDATNIFTQAPLFLDAAALKYQLTASSPGVNVATTPPTPLIPAYEYVHNFQTAQRQARVMLGGAWDVGAYEYGTPYLDVFPPDPPLPVEPTVVTSLPLPDAAGWYQLASTKLQQVDPCPAGNCEYTSVEGQSAVINSWNSASFDTTRNRLILWGGGHNAYWGNEVYAVTLGATPGVSRLTNPTVPVQPCTGYTGNYTSVDSRHTYDGIAYMPNVDKLFLYGGAISCSGGAFYTDTWTFSFTTLTWQQMTANGVDPPTVGTPGIMTSYDANTGKVFLHNLDCLYSYDPVTSIYEKMPGSCRGGAYQGTNYVDTGIIDPVRHKFLIIGGNDLLVYDITPGLPSYVPQRLTTTGGEAIVGGYYPGLAYDPVSQHVIGWNGGDTVYSLNLDTNVWTPLTFPGGPGAPNGNGTYKRFSYAPDIGAFVVVNGTAKDVFALKLGTTAPCDDSCPVCSAVNACGRRCPDCPIPHPPARTECRVQCVDMEPCSIQCWQPAEQ